MTIDTILKIGGALLGFAGTTVEVVSSHKRADEKIDKMVEKRVNEKFKEVDVVDTVECIETKDES